MYKDRGRVDTLVGLAMIGGSITGAVSLIAALFVLAEGSHTALGMCLIAAALSFGLLANAVLRE